MEVLRARESVWLPRLSISIVFYRRAVWATRSLLEVGHVKDLDFVRHRLGLYAGQERVELLQILHIDQLAPELGAYEGTRHEDQRLQPECGVHHVDVLQALAQSAVQHLVAPLQPRERGHVALAGAPVQVQEHIVLRDKLLQGHEDVSKGGQIRAGVRTRLAGALHVLTGTGCPLRSDSRRGIGRAGNRS